MTVRPLVNTIVWSLRCVIHSGVLHCSVNRELYRYLITIDTWKYHAWSTYEHEMVNYHSCDWNWNNYCRQSFSGFYRMV